MAAIICYDCTDANSFEHTEQWIKEYRMHRKNGPIIIASCKDDLYDPDTCQIDEDAGSEIAEKYKCRFI